MASSRARWSACSTTGARRFRDRFCTTRAAASRRRRWPRSWPSSGNGASGSGGRAESEQLATERDRGTLSDIFRLDLQIVVADHDIGPLFRRTFAEISPLAADIALVRRRGGIDRVEALPARRAARQRDIEIDLQKYRKVPTGPQLGTVQEDAVDDQRGGWLAPAADRRSNGRSLSRSKSPRDVSAGAARSSRDRATASETNRSRRNRDKTRQANTGRAHSEERADDGNHRPRRGSSGRPCAATSGASASASVVLPAPSTPSIATRIIRAGCKIDDGGGEAGQQRCVGFAHTALPRLTACWAARGPAACGCRGRSGY